MTDGALKAVARQALAQRTGARGLRSIMVSNVCVCILYAIIISLVDEPAS